MVFGPDGNLYISANADRSVHDPQGGEGGRVMVFKGTTGAFLGDAVPTRAGGTGVYRVAEAMALSFGPDGLLYVSNDPRTINADGGYNEAYNGLRFMVQVGASGVLPPKFKGVVVDAAINFLEDPNAMIWGPDGKLYIVWEDCRFDYLGDCAGAVMRYDPKTGVIDEPVTGEFGASIGFTEGQGIGIDRNGRLCVGSGDSAQVYEFDLSSDPPGYTVIPAYDEPKRLTFKRRW